MRRDTGYAKAGALFHRHAFRQTGNVIHGHHRKLSSRAKRTIRLCPVAPHRAAHPLRGNAGAQLIHAAGAVAMRNYTRIRHAVAKGILALLGITRVDARGSNANANFSGSRNRIRHLADHQHIAREPLFFVPSRFHFNLRPDRLWILTRRFTGRIETLPSLVYFSHRHRIMGMARLRESKAFRLLKSSWYVNPAPSGSPPALSLTAAISRSMSQPIRLRSTSGTS